MSCLVLVASIALIVFFHVILLHGTVSNSVFIGWSACFSISKDQCATILLAIGLAKRLASMVFGMEAGGRYMMEKMKHSCLASICASIVSVPIR